MYIQGGMHFILIFPIIITKISSFKKRSRILIFLFVNLACNLKRESAFNIIFLVTTCFRDNYAERLN